MKKSILSISMFICAAIAAKAQTSTTATTSAENPNQAEFKFEKEEYSFGTIKQGDKVEYSFVFTNTGKEPLIITDAQATCGCTVPKWPQEPIKKGEKGTINVIFNSTGKVGSQDKTITIHSNAKSNPKVLHLKGTVEVPPQEMKQADSPK